MVKLESQLPHMHLANKRVLVRVDYNVSKVDGKLVSDLRLRATIPTIQMILHKKAKVILLTHWGRPTTYDAALSTNFFLPWFKKQGFSIEFAQDLQTAYDKSIQSNADIILVENLRFFPGEKNHSFNFAQELARLGDVYVDDAFGLIHEADTSMTLLAELFPPEKRTIGLLMEQEIKKLNQLENNPAHPFVLMLGGNKVAEKTALLQNLCYNVDTLLLGPALVFSYLASQGKYVGSSLTDQESITIWKSLHTILEEKKIPVIIPTDYVVAKKDLEGELRVIQADEFKPDDVGITVGPETTKLYCQTIKNAQTALYDGLMGFIERPETLQATQEIFKAMAEVPMSIIGGGDSTAVAEKLNLKNVYLCSGGGAMVAYLGNQELPGLQPFLRN